MARRRRRTIALDPARRTAGSGPRRVWAQLIFGLACVLLANGLFGERGLTETVRARRAYAGARHDLARLKQENAALRSAARHLREDSTAVESIARGELGLVHRGEILVTVKDLHP
jgi:cell division protein FtsB